MDNKNISKIGIALTMMASSLNLHACALEIMLAKPAVQEITSSVKQKTFKASVSKSNAKNPKDKEPKDKEPLAATISNAHQYYVMFTSDDQISRGDFNNSKILIRGNRGSIFTTNGNCLKVLAGHISLENGGNSVISVMSEFGPLSVQPATTVDVYRVQDRDEIVVKQGALSLGEGAQMMSLHDGDFVTRDGQCTFTGSAIEAKAPVKGSGISLEPLRAWASEGSEFGVTALGVVELLKGECIFTAHQPLKIKTLCGSIESSDSDIVAVRVLTTGFFVENCAVRRTLKVTSHGHNLSLRGGESCILVNGAPEEAPQDGIGRRLCTSAFDGYMTAFRSEFSMVSLIQKLDAVYGAYKMPVSPNEKHFMQGWLKGIAALSIVQADKEDYSTTPKIMQKGKLGNFVNPFLSVQPDGADVSGITASANN